MSAKEILPDNPARKYCLIINDNATYPAYIGLGDSAITTSHGIRINVDGGNYEINATNLWTGPIYGIAAAAINILVTEW